MIAHEYGHILAGHFTSKATAGPDFATQPARSYLRKSWKEEFQADAVGWRLTLGPGFPTSRQIQTMSTAISGAGDPQTILDATDIQAAIAAPALFFGIDRLICAALVAGGHPVPEGSTHPSAWARRRRYVGRLAPVVERKGFLSKLVFAHRLDDVVERLLTAAA